MLQRKFSLAGVMRVREIYRILDANLNRAREGLRVLEEIARFVLEDPGLTARLKELRHGLTGQAGRLPGGHQDLVGSRDAAGDVGAESWTSGEKTRESLPGLAAANFKRVQEAARVLEEFGKLLGPAAEGFKKLRFEAYVLEQEMLARLQTQGQARGNDETS